MYFCVANNGIGEPDIKRYGLDVEFPPTISVPRPKVAQALDYNIKLECRVLAYPAPAVSWFKNDQELHNTDDYRCDYIKLIASHEKSLFYIFILSQNSHNGFT